MSRAIRKASKTGIYHVILRGINRQDIFLDDEDFAFAIEKLGQGKAGIPKTIWVEGEQKETVAGSYRLYGYCLMTNHIHLLIKSIASEGSEVPADTDELSRAVKRFAGCYAQYFNFRYQRCGALFQDRYRSEPVETEAYFLAALRYIHQNPIKAAVADKLDAYKWSSYRDYRSQGGITDRGLADKLLGSDFVGFMAADNDDECLEIDPYRLDDLELSKIIREELGVPAGRISGLHRNERNALLRKAIAIPGATPIQMARVTGVQVHTIWRLDGSGNNRKKPQQRTTGKGG
jgi:REP element-mobilizing transposase RayT